MKSNTLVKTDRVSLTLLNCKSMSDGIKVEELLLETKLVLEISLHEVTR